MWDKTWNKSAQDCLRPKSRLLLVSYNPWFNTGFCVLQIVKQNQQQRRMCDRDFMAQNI